jgi:hypothetical protein
MSAWIHSCANIFFSYFKNQLIVELALFYAQKGKYE